MRKSISTFIRFIWGSSTKPDPIEWKFTVQKIGTDTYRVYVTAFISDSWRLYSGQSAGEGLMPTLVEFEESAFIHLLGSANEMGLFKEEFDTKLDTRTRYCTSVVSFVQEVKTDGRPVSVKGKIVFIACTEKRCLEPKEIEFQVELD